MRPSIKDRSLDNIKVMGSDAPIAHEDWANVKIDGGILNYVRRQMHCEKVTPEVKRQALAFEREMSRMQGW